MALKQGKLTIDSFAGGWGSDFSKGTASAPATKASTYYTGLVNLNKPNNLGQLSSAFGENPLTYTTNSLYLNGTYFQGTGAFIQANGLISALNLTVPFGTLGPTDYNAPAGCTTDAYKDIWSHVTVAGIPSLLFTYQTASNAFVGLFPNLTPGLRNDTYFTLTYLNVPHVGCKSVANQSYITDGNYLQAYNPNAALPFGVRINVGTGWTLCSVTDYGNYVAVVGNDGNSARMWLWNGTSQDPNFQYDIRDTTVTAIINEGGDLRVFCYGKNGTTKVKTFTGNGFSEEADWETPTSLCASPTHGMVDVWLNQIVWRTPDGYVWTYGSPRKNELPSGANRSGKLTNTGSSSLGCVKNLYQQQLYIGMLNGGQNYLYNVKADESYGITMDSSLKTVLYSLPHGATINMIRLYFSSFFVFQGGSSSTFQMSLYENYNTTTDYLSGYTVPTTVTVDTTLYYHPIKCSIPTVDAFYMNMTFRNCTIRKIEVEFSYDDRSI